LLGSLMAARLVNVVSLIMPSSYSAGFQTGVLQ
jgi:hypothetical protein